MSSPAPQPASEFYLNKSRLIRAVVGLALVIAWPGVLPAQEDAECLDCHAEQGLFEGLPNADSLWITRSAHENSMHGLAGLTCVDCHQDLIDFGGVHDDELQPADCSMCHDDAQADFEASVHGYARSRGHPQAPDCATCHGTHDILPSTDRNSPTHGARLIATCNRCHSNAALNGDALVKHVQTASKFAESVHGRLDADGIPAASCIDCHGAHRLRGAGDHESGIHRENVAATCGQCHEEVGAVYAESIHGRALRAGVSDSPTCTDCHGEHMIQPTRSANDAKAESLASRACRTCHNDPRIIAKYDLDGSVVDSYEDSYHGWATEASSERAATCVSCHTAHGALPQRHPDSTIHPDNVVETCRKCHERADARFAASYTHEKVSLTQNPINRMIRNLYWVLITLVIGGMAVHNLIILRYFAAARLRKTRSVEWITRFTTVEIIQHMALAVSFIVLAVTGFALRYPNAWWVRRLGALGMSEAARSTVHRGAAVVLIVASVGHLVYLAFTARGRQAFRDMCPRKADATDLLQNLRYHAGQSDVPARFDRFDYTQKAEYWALIWGTVLMAVTGVVLWTPELVVKILPTWVVAASQTVHYYEAWLATLAIVVWHFFFVIFHPEEYPMNWTWLDGKMARSAARKHHARWRDDSSPEPPATAQAAPSPDPDSDSEPKAG